MMQGETMEPLKMEIGGTQQQSAAPLLVEEATQEPGNFSNLCPCLDLPFISYTCRIISLQHLLLFKILSIFVLITNFYGT